MGAVVFKGLYEGTGLGICSMIFLANSSFFVSKKAICSKKIANRYCHSFVKSNRSDSLTGALFDKIIGSVLLRVTLL